MSGPSSKRAAAAFDRRAAIVEYVEAVHALLAYVDYADAGDVELDELASKVRVAYEAAGKRASP